ncbi:hypothetical protein [Candidatus Ichthyocystis sparus]|uniref:hypothetical protein n=1 Tax=Candidatus Ichthyocystis sparus TaxID=1561004 RepID=UPI000B870FBC|nr:hypothetical protein [Candidatus Ichthyocystis sparus]
MYPVPVASGVSSSGVASEIGTNKVGIVLDVDLKQIESSSSVTISTIADRGGVLIVEVGLLPKNLVLLLLFPLQLLPLLLHLKDMTQ